jgi:putative oxidoreductase
MTKDLALLLLRLTGLGLALAHGWGKIEGIVTGDVRMMNAVADLGFPLPVVFTWAAALSEFAGGVLVAAGLYTRFAAGFAAFTMFVAAFVRHHAHQHLLVVLGVQQASEEVRKTWGDPEKALLYLVAFVAIALAGPGRLSLDSLIRKK